MGTGWGRAGARAVAGCVPVCGRRRGGGVGGKVTACRPSPARGGTPWPRLDRRRTQPRRARRTPTAGGPAGVRATPCATPRRARSRSPQRPLGVGGATWWGPPAATPRRHPRGTRARTPHRRGHTHGDGGRHARAGERTHPLAGCGLPAERAGGRHGWAPPTARRRRRGPLRSRLCWQHRLGRAPSRSARSRGGGRAVPGRLARGARAAHPARRGVGRGGWQQSRADGHADAPRGRPRTVRGVRGPCSDRAHSASRAVRDSWIQSSHGGSPENRRFQPSCPQAITVDFSFTLLGGLLRFFFRVAMFLRAARWAQSGTRGAREAGTAATPPPPRRAWTLRR